ncbi:MAG: GNAT family protein [Aliishimia sp.]
MIQVINKPTLTGQRVTLRAPTLGDVPARFELGNTPEIQRMFGSDPSQARDITQSAAEFWVKSHIDDPAAWAIDVDDTLIGAVRLYGVNHADKRANIAIGILSEAHLGKGFGTEAMLTLARHAFNDMKLHRLSSRVLAFNERAIASYEKVGFQQEGRERQSALIGATWHDEMIMGLLSSDLADVT